MSDTTIVVVKTTQNIQWFSQAAGAVFAILGGFFAVIIRLRLEKRNEIDCIKISLTDELTDIVDIIRKFKETFDATALARNTYLNDLEKSWEAYSHHHQRFFLIGNAELRREIVSFYKALQRKISDSVNRVGNLNPGSEDGQIVGEFVTLSATASGLISKIQRYKYRAYWIR